jgi:hypothetical protein
VISEERKQELHTECLEFLQRAVKRAQKACGRGGNMPREDRLLVTKMGLTAVKMIRQFTVPELRPPDATDTLAELKKIEADLEKKAGSRGPVAGA